MQPDNAGRRRPVSSERADGDIFPIHVGPGRHVTTCALHAPVVGGNQNVPREI
jgi:hypothetical protein